MSLFSTAISTLQEQYESSRKQYNCTAQLLAIAIVGTLCAIAGIHSQKYFLSALSFLLTFALSRWTFHHNKITNAKNLSLGWKLLIVALCLLLLQEVFSFPGRELVPFSALVLLSLSPLAQVTFVLGLVLLAWPTEKHIQIRAFIDSLVIVLALLVMAWTKGVHPSTLHFQLQNATFYSWIFWVNTISGIFVMMSILFYFIAAHSSHRPNRGTLWISAGAIFFLLIHIFRTYTLEGIEWNHLTDLWLITSCSLVILTIIFIAIGLVWHQATERTERISISLEQPNSQQRLITLWLPYCAALAVSLILLINEIVPNNDEGGGLLPIVLLLIAILSRQMLTMWDNLRLSEKLTESNVNLENSVSERTQHLAILHSITSTLNSSLDKSSVLKIALEQIMVATKAQQGAIWLRYNDIVDPENSRWQLSYAKGFVDKNHENTLRDVVIAIVDDRVILNERTQHLFQKVYGFPPSSGKLLVVPIRSGGLLLGAQALILKNEHLPYDTRSVVESIALEVGTSLQNALLYQEARQRADRDGVTGLYNHRAIQERLTALLQNAQKTGEPFAVLMMDLNDFKYFNDTYGHPVGDDVLRNVATHLDKTSGAKNIVGRYGGDEFIMLMPGQNQEQAHQTYLTVLQGMEKEHFEVAPGVRIPITMSYGWSVYPDDGQNALDLVTIADANLYRYKQRGELEESSLATNRRKAAVDKSSAFGVLDALITAIDNKDHYTRKHSDEVAQYAVTIAEELGYSSESLRAVRISGLLHDVGKIAVPDDILRHPGKLSRADWEIMRGHPTFGALIVKDLPYLEDVISGIRSHHERWDGKGYPDGLAGTEIPMMGRLLAVPDTYSALTTNRPYRKGHTPQEALLEIERSILTQFDPLIAKTFIKIMQRELNLVGTTLTHNTPNMRADDGGDGIAVAIS